MVRIFPSNILLVLTLFLLVLTSTQFCDTEPTRSGRDTDPGDSGNYSHTLNAGKSAEDFLKKKKYETVTVEIQYMPGYRPTDTAMEDLRIFLKNHLNKSDIIILDPEEIPSGGQDQYSSSDIRELEEQHRRHYTEDGSLASYNIFIDGEYSQDNVIGIAYYNTSTAYFGRTIHDISGSPPLSPAREKVESTVLRHEYGHLLGLVDSGTEMQEEHQENGSHCSEDECVMFHTVNTTDFFSNLFDGSIPDLEAFCIADIQAVPE